jgi:hypothetical protein
MKLDLDHLSFQEIASLDEIARPPPAEPCKKPVTSAITGCWNSFSDLPKPIQ